MTEFDKKLLTTSLASYTIAGFFFAVGLISKNNIALVFFYLLSIFLFLSGMLALFRRYQKNKQDKLFLFLDFIGIALIMLVTLALFGSL